MKIAEAFVEVRADTTRVKGDLDKGITGPAKSTASKVKTLFAGAAVGLFAKGAFDEFEEAEKATKQLAQTIKSTGGAANVSADQVNKLADSISDTAAVDDELVVGAARLLLTFKEIKNTDVDKTFDRATKAAVDMAAGLGGDAQSAALQLGKALNEPVRGLTLLQRAGISFTAQQKEQVKAMVEAGQVAKAQGIILGEVESQFGGQAEAAATGADKARVAFANLQESVGASLAPAIEAGAKSVEGLSNAFAKQPVALQQAELGVLALAFAYSKLQPAFSAVGSGIEKASAALGRFRAGDATKSISGFGAGLSGTAVVAGGAFAAGLGIAAFALYEFSRASEAADKGAEALRNSAEATGDTLSKTLLKSVNELAAGIDNNLADTLGDSAKKFGDNARDLGFSVKDITGALQGSDAEFKAFKDRVLEAGIELDHSGTRAGIFTSDLDTLRGSFEGATDAEKKAAKGAVELGIGMDDAATGTTDAAGAVAEFKSEAEKAQDSIDNLTDSINDYVDEVQGAAGLSDDFQSSLNDLAGAADEVRKNGKGLFAGTTDEAIAFRDAQRDVVSGGADIISKATEEGATVRGLTLIREALARQYLIEAEKAKVPKKAADEIAAAIRGIPVVSKTKFEQPGMEGATRNTANLFRKLGEIDGRRVTAHVDADTSRADAALRQWLRSVEALSPIINVGGGFGNKRAAGGPLPEGLTLVGEEGPELVTKQGSKVDVLSNRQTRAAFGRGGGGGLTINVTVNGAVGDRTALMRYIIDGINEVQGRRAG